MAESGHLRLLDLRACYHLLGECRELGRDARAWRVHMLDGLRRLAGAQVALYLHLRELGSPAERVTEPLDVGFLSTSERALWARYQREEAHRDDPFHLRYYRVFTRPQRTRSLAAVVDLRAWHASRHYNDYVRACGLEDRIASSLRLPGTSIQTIVLHRAAADGPYPERAVRLVRFFHGELAPLLGCRLALPGESATPALPPQLQRVLLRVLRGEAEKEIAAHLGISRHTVNRHVQRLFERFGVHSRGELVFRCRDMFPLLDGPGWAGRPGDGPGPQ